jgi:hypothetical protein
VTDDLQTTLLSLQAQRPTSPIGIYYHPDADPGDGAGWCLEVGDTRSYGSLVEVIAAAVAAGEVPRG